MIIIIFLLASLIFFKEDGETLEKILSTISTVFLIFASANGAEHLSGMIKKDK